MSNDDLYQPGPAQPSEGDASAENETSLAGKGWDILVGGKAHAAEMGGEDPFDAQPKPDFSPAAAADEVLGSITGSGEPGISPGALSNGEKVVIELEALNDDHYKPAPALPAQPGPPLGEGAEVDDGPALPSIPKAPPVTEVPDVYTGAPARPAGSSSVGTGASPARVVSKLTVDPQAIKIKSAIVDPFVDELPGKDLHPSPDVPIDTEIVQMLITPQRVRLLWEQINQAYEDAVSDVRGDYKATEGVLAKLKDARMLLMAGEEYFDNAEELLMQAKARLLLEEKVRRWTLTRGTGIAIYLILWLCLLIFGSLMNDQVIAFAQGRVPNWMAAIYLPALFGSLGGVVGALWVLIKHTSKRRDFDPIHTTWYLTNPFMGLLLGIVAYIIIFAGGNVLTLATSGSMTDLATASTSPAIPLIYPICLIVGFNQNLLWRLIDRFIKAIVPADEDEESTTSASTPPPPQPPANSGAG